MLETVHLCLTLIVWEALGNQHQHIFIGVCAHCESFNSRLCFFTDKNNQTTVYRINTVNQKKKMYQIVTGYAEKNLFCVEIRPVKVNGIISHYCNLTLKQYRS